MKGRKAGMIFLMICLALAILLVMDVLSPAAGVVVFATSLALLGTVSGGFRGR